MESGNYNELYNQKSEAEKQFANDLYAQILDHEGKRNYAYLDSQKIPTIGIGFNLQDKDNQRIVKQMGFKVEDLASGKVRLDDNTVKMLYNESIKKAYDNAKQWLPDLESHPADVQKAVIDMSFNLGLTRLSKFAKTKEALQKRDYKTAASEMLDSKWASQTGRRAKKLAEMVGGSS